MGEALIVHGLGNVDIASEIVATLDLDRIVRGGENHHGAALEVFVLFQPLENVDPAHIRQVQIKQDEQGHAFVVDPGSVRSEQESDGFRSVGEGTNGIVHAGAADVFFD